MSFIILAICYISIALLSASLAFVKIKNDEFFSFGQLGIAICICFCLVIIFAVNIFQITKYLINSF